MAAQPYDKRTMENETIPTITVKRKGDPRVGFDDPVQGRQWAEVDILGNPFVRENATIRSLGGGYFVVIPNGNKKYLVEWESVTDKSSVQAPKIEAAKE